MTVFLVITGYYRLGDRLQILYIHYNINKGAYSIVIIIQHMPTVKVTQRQNIV